MIRHSFAVSFTLISLAGCESTGLAPTGGDAGVCPYPTSAAEESAYLDCLVAAPRLARSYRPDGCTYDVSSPAVSEFRRDETHLGPAPTPTSVHVSFAGDASTTFAVNWGTDLLTTGSELLVGTDEAAVTAATGATSSVRRIAGHSVAYETVSAGDTIYHRAHEAHVCGLTADTVYYYKVGEPGAYSEVYEYRTAPALGTTQTFRFAVSGDSRTPQQNRWARSQKSLFDRAQPIRLEVFSGDAVFLGSNQNEWNGFFNASEQSFSVDDLLASVPFMVTNGNHDGLAVNYLAQFALPQQVTTGERGEGEEWYSFDYGNAHFLVLNDTVMSSDIIANDERAFVASDLAAVDRTVTPWVFVVHHRPLYTCLSSHQPDLDARAAWQPLFDQYGVDVVFAGHNHVYERSRPIRGLDSGNGIVAASGANGVPVITNGTPSGTLYVVSAGVGAELYSVSDTCAFTQTAISAPNYTVVTLTGRTIAVDVVDYTSGSTLDTFTYSK